MRRRIFRWWLGLRDFVSLLRATVLMPDGTIHVLDRPHHGTRKGDQP